MSDDKPSGPRPSGWHSRYWDRRQFNERKFVKSGSYLECYCPHCGKSLIESGMARFAVISPEGERGTLEVKPYLNVHEHSSDITLLEGREVQDLLCPHCGESFVVPDRKCGDGDSRVAAILIAVSNHKVPFLFCLRVGCSWHEIHPDHADQIILDDSKEW
jgi:predicted RNA-binding Zn-ribbon protein involved in translation (DUF1610 family)